MRAPVLALALALMGVAPAAAAPPPGVDPQRLSDTVKTLASDDFQGRAPGTPGEAKTVDWLVASFKALGLQPAGENGGWTQAVPLVRTKVKPGSSVGLGGGGAVRPLVLSRDVYVSSLLPQDEVALPPTPMVFVGYGVKAPERGWDDFKGADLKGKVLVFLVNDPDFEAQAGDDAAGKFGGKAMTYYGRWTYKYEEAARQGAAGALIVHETPGAGYGWSTVIAPQGEAYDVVRGPGDPKPVSVQGWLARDAAADIFKAAGLDFEAMKRAARRSDFRPVPLEIGPLIVDLKLDHVRVESHNVLAKLPGRDAPGESVMVAAHWDAYGVGAPDAAGATIRRGALDDGVGIAGVLEIARALKAGPPPRRAVTFAAWTAEERGLLGSEWYARHPLQPLPTTAANLTMDIVQTAGPSRDVVLVGAGQNGLEDLLADAARAQGRTVTPDDKPERGLFYRADHFSVAKRGVPTLLIMGIGGGPDLVTGGRAAGDRWVGDYTTNCYHKACDAWSPSQDYAAAAADIDLLLAMTRRLADGREWPQWRATSEFRSVRDATAAERR